MYIHIYIYIYICVCVYSLIFCFTYISGIVTLRTVYRKCFISDSHIGVYIHTHTWIYVYIYTPSVLVIYQCVTAYPKTQWLKAKSVHYHRVSTGQGSCGGLGGCFWLHISHEAVVKLSSRNASPLTAQTGLENLFQTHSHGCGQTTVLSHMGCLPGGCVSRIMGTGD